MQTTKDQFAVSRKIAEIIASTPVGPSRTKALKAIRWVLACAEGEEGYAILNGMECAITKYVDSAIKFDGRDNEALKARFWEKQLGVKLVAALL